MQDPANRKKCPNPNCGAPIEKRSGCNHMTCTKCSTHMCWLCLKSFKSSDEVYEHQAFCVNNQGPH